jgi:hypothetical protein
MMLPALDVSPPAPLCVYPRSVFFFFALSLREPINNPSPPCRIIPCSETHVTVDFQEQEKKIVGGRCAAGVTCVACSECNGRPQPRQAAPFCAIVMVTGPVMTLRDGARNY